MLVFFFLAGSLAAQKTVSGRIINRTDKKPVEGASVMVKGSTTGIATAANGSFSIAVPTDKSVLIVSGTDFETLEVSVAGKTNLGDISIASTTLSLNEVVVTGYTAQRKKDITGAVSVVNVENMKNVPSGTIEYALQGQASGVTVINNGAPGGPSNVRVRGITSTGPTDPLVIIDGTPGNMHDLNPNDIQSLQVLKDAGSAAIYGVRGSNGVIIITTKKGKTGSGPCYLRCLYWNTTSIR